MSELCWYSSEAEAQEAFFVELRDTNAEKHVTHSVSIGTQNQFSEVVLTEAALQRFQDVASGVAFSHVCLKEIREEREGLVQRLLQILDEKDSIRGLTMQAPCANPLIETVLNFFPARRFESVYLDGVVSGDMEPGEFAAASGKLIALAQKCFGTRLGGYDFDLNLLLAWLQSIQECMQGESGQPTVDLHWTCGWDSAPEGGLDGLARTFFSCDVVTSISMDLEYFNGTFMTSLLASFLNILQDGACRNLTEWALSPINYGSSNRIDRYIDPDGRNQDTFPTLTAALARNTHIKKLEVTVDQSCQELLTDCILPALKKNRGVTHLTLNIGYGWQNPSAEYAMTSWNAICDVLSSNDCLISMTIVGWNGFYDFYNTESIPEEIRAGLFARFRFCLLENYVLEDLEFKDNLSAISADIPELNTVPNRNQLIRTTREFIEQTQRHEEPGSQDVAIHAKAKQLQTAVQRNELVMPALYQLVKAFVPVAGKDLVLRLSLLIDEANQEGST